MLSAHLAAFATLLPQPLPLLPEAEPEALTVSLLSAPQATTQKSKPPVKPTPKVEKTVKPEAIEKKLTHRQAKPAPPTVRKTPLRKPVIERSQATAMPVEKTLASMPEKNMESIAKPAATSANKPATAAPGFQSPSFNASYLDNPAPNYPSISRRLGEQGKVLLRVQVAVDGTADSVVLQTSSGSSRLDQAALAAVKKWRFVPARRGGQAVVASVVVPVSFSIEG